MVAGQTEDADVPRMRDMILAEEWAARRGDERWRDRGGGGEVWGTVEGGE